MEIRPAATVILLRDSDVLEVLVQRRSQAMAFAPGAYAFPGGALDPEDHIDADPFRHAAVRELAEESGIVVDPRGLYPWARWITPPGRTRRFDTWFYLAAAPADAEIKQSADDEVEHHLWVAPIDLLARYEREEVTMLPPTRVTLTELTEFATVADALAATEGRSIPFFDGETIRPL